VAAALSIKEKVNASQMDIVALKKALSKQGVRIDA